MSRSLFFLLFIFLTGCNDGKMPVSSDDGELENRINQLVANMTLEEKIGQTALRGTSSREKGNLSEELKTAVRAGKIGAFLNVMNPENVAELQRIAVEESPNGIPLIFARDVVHGFKTIFPIPLGMAASWDTNVAYNAARVSAFEASGVGIRWTFAPMLDIARDARWGRIAESPGEDPFLGAVLGKAYVSGFQSDDPSDPTRIAACVKHFMGYGAAIGGRDYNTAIIHDALMRNVYLPPFSAALENGALTVMASFNELNGVPATGNKYVLSDILREELGFSGFVVSDWNSVIEMIPHGFAADAKEAAKHAALAGMEMEMTSTAYDDHLAELIEAGQVPEAQLDLYVKNILRVKFKLGLFDQPYPPSDHDGSFYAPQHLEAAKEAAIRSTVLLKNNAILPLDKTAKVALIGPLADAPHEQLGTWTFDGEEEHSVTPRQAFVDEGVTFSYASCLSHSRDKTKGGFGAAMQAARQSDVILFFGGEEAILSGEAHSRANIDLPGAQEAAIDALAATGKPIVLVIMAGRPITIAHLIDKVDAVVMAWHPGTMGGPALHDILFGLREPGGRLPVTWPKTSGQLPLFYNHKNTGRPADSSSYVGIDDIPIGAWQSSLGNESHYLDVGFTPHFPFGFGLGYTEFSYDGLTLSSKSLNMDGTLQVSTMVTNTGTRAGETLAQLYIQDVTASITRPVKELKGFQRVTLEPGTTQEVTFTVSPQDLAFFNNDKQQLIEAGKFKVWVGPHSADGPSGSFDLLEE